MEAIHNFRDFGGYKTLNGTCLKKGLLYRSGDLANATNADLEHLAALGIKTICDLRSAREKTMEPDRFPNPMPFVYLNLPMRPILDYHNRSLGRLFSLMFGRERRKDYVAESHKAYREYATGYLPQLRSLFQCISNPANLPLLLHCSAGKDRTGVVASLIQLLLGVPVELVMEDYLKTNDRLSAYTEDVFQKISRLSYFGVPWQIFAPLFEARPEYLGAALAQVEDDFGPLDEWFRRGLGYSERERLDFVSIFQDRLE